MHSEDNLLINVHENLPNPTKDGTTYLVKGTYSYHHYGCDKFMDKGWGCGYRTLQTLCSWIRNNQLNTIVEPLPPPVPTILEIQKTLVKLEDKPKSFIGSKDWIGSVEVYMIIDQLYNVPCKIIHVNSGKELNNYVKHIIEHFETCSSPIMMGGDKDCSSKGIMGIHVSTNGTFLLIVDPHFVGIPKSAKQLQKNSWVKWQNISDFLDSSFYNFCLPQLICTS